MPRQAAEGWSGKGPHKRTPKGTLFPDEQSAQFCLLERWYSRQKRGCNKIILSPFHLICIKIELKPIREAYGSMWVGRGRKVPMSMVTERRLFTEIPVQGVTVSLVLQIVRRNRVTGQRVTLEWKVDLHLFSCLKSSNALENYFNSFYF